MIYASYYLGVGAVAVMVGLVTMLPRWRELLNPRVFLRVTGFGILALLLWPVIVLLGIVWQFRAGRAWMIDHLGRAR